MSKRITQEEKITKEALIAKLREAAETINSASLPARETAWRAGIITAALLIILAYFLGRRKGRMSCSLIEVTRA